MLRLLTMGLALIRSFILLDVHTLNAYAALFCKFLFSLLFVVIGRFRITIFLISLLIPKQFCLFYLPW